MTSTIIRSSQICCKNYTRAKFKGELRSSGMLRNVEWQFHTDVSGQPVGPIFRGVSRPSQTAPIRCPKTSVHNCHSTLHCDPEERKSRLHRGGSHKLRKLLQDKILKSQITIKVCNVFIIR